MGYLEGSSWLVHVAQFVSSGHSDTQPPLPTPREKCRPRWPYRYPGTLEKHVEKEGNQVLPLVFST